MRKIFEEYGGVIIIVAAIGLLGSLVFFLMQPGGVVDLAFGNITNSFVQKAEGLINQGAGNGDNKNGSWVWVEKEWDGVPSSDNAFNARNIWTDGTNYYYSYNLSQYILNGDTWEPKTWEGFAAVKGQYIWTDGTDFYYSNGSPGSNQYVLNGDTWEEMTWNGLDSHTGMFLGNYIWTDGTSTYYSGGSGKQYILNGDTWEPKTWGGFTAIDASYIWTDGTSYYYSDVSKQYVLNGDTWEEKTWAGQSSLVGSEIWTDGTNYYCSSGNGMHDMLDGDTWVSKTFEGMNPSYGRYIWSDGTNTYYSSSGRTQYVYTYVLE